MSSIAVEAVARWRIHRMKFDPHGLNNDLSHQVAHIIKALGPVAAIAEHRDHEESDTDIELKRLADLAIHAVWAADLVASSLGYKLPDLVADRMESFDDGFIEATSW